MKGFFRLYLRAQAHGACSFFGVLLPDLYGFLCAVRPAAGGRFVPRGPVRGGGLGSYCCFLCANRAPSARTLSLMQHHPADLPDELPAAQSPQEQAYQALLLALHADRQKLKSDMNARYHDMAEYYTVWAHQIKTPIAAIRLALQNEDTAAVPPPDGARWGAWSNMCRWRLAYLRLGSDSSDYVIRSCALDDIVRRRGTALCGRVYPAQNPAELSNAELHGDYR